jgi:cytochrome c553
MNRMKNVVLFLLLAGVSSFSVAAGSAQAGADKVAVCVACHGPDGNSSVLPEVPKLGARGEKYLTKQLRDIKTGIRPVALMTGLLNNMSDQDLADIAAFYNEQPLSEGATDAAKLELGQALYRAGNASLGVPACTACHGPEGMGMDDAAYPALSGQDEAYVNKTLRDFRAGNRMNDNASMMRTIVARLNEDELSALASFVAGLRR